MGTEPLAATGQPVRPSLGSARVLFGHVPDALFLPDLEREAIPNVDRPAGAVGTLVRPDLPELEARSSVFMRAALQAAGRRLPASLCVMQTCQAVLATASVVAIEEPA